MDKVIASELLSLGTQRKMILDRTYGIPLSTLHTCMLADSI